MNTTLFFSQTINSPVWRLFFVVPLVLIVLDVCSGVLSALVTHQFDGASLSQFLGHDLLSFTVASFLVFVTFLLFGGAQVATELAALLGLGPLSVSVGHSIASNIGDILKREGVPAPVVASIEAAIPQKETQVIPAPFTLSTSTTATSLSVRAKMAQRLKLPAVFFPNNL